MSATGPAAATDYTILTTADDSTPGNCSLREAIQAAELDQPVDACPAGGAHDLIHLPPGIYDFSHGEEFIDSSGTLSIVADDDAVIIDLGEQNRFLAISETNVVLDRLRIRNGRGANGGAVHAYSSDLTLRSIDFEFNVASLSGGALYFQGWSGGDLLVTDSLFAGNSAQQTGGGAHVAVRYFENAAIRDSQFFENEAEQGGGLKFFSAGTAACVRCNFVSNVSDTYGGGANLVAMDGGVVRLIDASFTFNTAVDDEAAASSLLVDVIGGTAEVDRLSARNGQGQSTDLFLSARASGDIIFTNALLAHGDRNGLEGIATDDGQIAISHATLVRYSTGTGARLIAQSGGSIRLENSIVALNQVDLLVTPTGVEFDHSFVGEDPFFDEDPPDFHLASGSPAIDACDAPQAPLRLADLDHRPRVFGLAPDCGAFETGSGLFADGFESSDAGSWTLQAAGT